MKFYYLITALGALGIAIASTLTPPVLPLIVRNPYLSTWLTSARDKPWERWPIFWTGQSVGFSVMASVPDTSSVYPLLGRPHDSLSRDDSKFRVSLPEYLGSTFDASTTNLTYLIPGPGAPDKSSSENSGSRDKLKVTLSFLSPITPTSTFRQSMPAAYLNVIVEGTFHVDIYIDLNGEWVSGDRGSRIKWELTEPSSSPSSVSKAGSASPSATPVKTWKVVREVEQLFTEFADRAEWGTLYFSAPASVRHESGVSAGIRTQFARTGILGNVIDSGFRRIMEDEPVFAFAKSFHLKANKTTTDSVLFTFALVQNPIVQYASARGLTYMRPLWASYLYTPDALIRYHYSDFPVVSRLARRYAKQLSEDAFASGSKEYEEIASLSARQVLGATEFSGTPDNPLLYLKEISSNGNSQTVDVIFPAFPFFLYTNPRWLAYLLEPLLEHQLSGQYPNDYSMHDLGYHFPNETGHDDGNDEYMPVEECGNMLIMGLALINAFKYDTTPAFGRSGTTEAAADVAGAIGLALTEPQALLMDAYGLDRPWGTDDGDASAAPEAMTGAKEAKEWAARSYKLWKQWTGYLVRESLVPRSQLSTDDFAGWLAYQTNLALKGIIGIRAMSEIADLLGEKKDAKYYRNISDTYATKWIEYGMSRDGSHAKLAYDWYGSWTTLYNLYADSLLCFHIPEVKETAAADSSSSSSVFLPDRIYKAQSDWYHNVLQRYGLPLDSRHLYTKSDWEFFAAAITSRSTRAEILSSVARWLNETDTNMPFTDLYDTEGTGSYPPGLTFKARPVVGGHFSFLALERACGGKAMEALSFLESDPEPPQLAVQAMLDSDREPFLETVKEDEEAPEQIDEL